MIIHHIRPRRKQSLISRLGIVRSTRNKFQTSSNINSNSASTNLRTHQMQMLSTIDVPPEMTASEKQANRELAAGVTALALTTSGHLAAPPLLLASVPFLLYLAYTRLRSAYKKLYVERRLGIILVDSIWFMGALLTGNLFWAAFGGVAYGIGSKLLARTEDSTRKAMTNILGEQPSSVWVLVNGTEVLIPFEQLQRDDILVLGAGQIIPVDGTIVEGVASIDQRMLTGESQPAEKEVGDQVLASTLLVSGKIGVRVDKTGKDTVTAKIGEILLESADFQLALQSRGEAITDRSTLPTLFLSVLGLSVAGPSGALALLGNYPGANLRLLSPITVLNFLQRASQNGILIKDGRSMEMMSQIDTIVFDKTGTLTLDTPHVGDIHLCSHFSEDELLQLAATAEYKQPHPIAKTILQAAEARDLPLTEIQDAHYEVGYGIKVYLDQRLVCVGSERFMKMEGVTIPATLQAVAAACQMQGHALVMVAVDNQLAGAIELHATVRPEAKMVVEQLHERDIDLYIISGDQEAPTKKLANELGIEHYFANTLPENKAQLIEELQASGKKVCFIGDGINDSIALGQADVSVSLLGASTIATDTAQIILMDGTLERLIDLLNLTTALDNNMNRSVHISYVPGLIGIGAVFLFQLGLAASCVIYALGLGAGMLNGIHFSADPPAIADGN